jgi:hypothetical protein
MYELEVEWQTATDGFLAGVDFNEWLANQVVALRKAAQQGVQSDGATCPACEAKSIIVGTQCLVCGVFSPRR